MPPKIVSITNGYDPEQFCDIVPVAADSEDRPLTILHPGQIYAGRDPRPFFDALRAVLAHRDPSDRPIRALHGTSRRRFAEPSI